jgi:uncharacterized protein YndB with AHSA1/START domain
MRIHSTGDKEVFQFQYEFNAPKKMVFKAFADAEALNKWWGPVETSNSVITLDFRPGGIFHFKMEAGGHISYGRFIFKTIQPYDLLEFTNSFADENANLVKAPFDISIPLEIFYSLHFTEHAGKTTISMTGIPVNASAEEITGFLAINSSMEKGFGATFNELSKYLSKNISQ